MTAAAKAGPVRPARRGRLGLGLGQGVRLARSIIILMLGYIPDRAYYLTVGRTVDLGRPRLVADQPLPARERDAAVPGAGRWRRAVGRVAARAGAAAAADRRRRRPGRDAAPVHRRHRTARRRSRHVFVAKTVGTGNFDKWAEGPALPAPRADASVAFVAGSVYVIGGLDADGAPTDDGLRPQPDGTDRRAGRVEGRADGARPARGPLRRGAATATADGLLLIGGAERGRPGHDDLEDATSTQPARSGAWTPEQPLVTPQADATAVVVGDYVWLYGGSDANGPVGDRPARRVRPAGRRGPARRTPTRARSSRWAVERHREPARRRGRTRPAGRANGAHLPRRRQRRVRGRRPSSTGRSRRTTGDIPSGSTSTVSDLPDAADGRRARGQRPERDHRRRHDDAKASSPRAFGRTSPRRARSSSSASSARPCPA